MLVGPLDAAIWPSLRAMKEALLGSPPSLSTLAWNFLVLGATAFGGPPVHISMFRARFVEKSTAQGNSVLLLKRHKKSFSFKNIIFWKCVSRLLKTSKGFERLLQWSRFAWLSNERFAELFAMANCLPGPSSTQAQSPFKLLESLEFDQVAFAIGITQGSASWPL